MEVEPLRAEDVQSAVDDIAYARLIIKERVGPHIDGGLAKAAKNLCDDADNMANIVSFRHALEAKIDFETLMSKEFSLTPLREEGISENT
jgi:hypothetical protein